MYYPTSSAYGAKVKLSDNLQSVWEFSRMVTTVRERGMEHSEPQLFAIVPECNLSSPTLSSSPVQRSEARALVLAIVWNLKAGPRPCVRLYIHKLTCQIHDQLGQSQLLFLICP